MNYLNVPVADIRDFLNYGESSTNFLQTLRNHYYSYSYSDLKRIEFDLIHCLIGLDKRIGRTDYSPRLFDMAKIMLLKLFKDRIAHECHQVITGTHNISCTCLTRFRCLCKRLTEAPFWTILIAALMSASISNPFERS